MKKIVVTGATSMIGVAIIEEALKNEIDRIYAVVRVGTNNLDRLPKSDKIVVIACEMNNYIALTSLIPETCEVFYHIAWSSSGANRNDSPLSQSENILYTLQALTVAKTLGCAKFVGAGSQAEYGISIDKKIGPSSITNPLQSYGIAKLAAGKLALLEAEKIGLACAWVRIFSVYGKYDRSTSMISSTIKKLLSREKTEFTRGEQLWDYLYSSDAGRAFFLIGKRSTGQKIYCLGSGVARPLHKYIEIIGDAVNTNIDLGIGVIPYNENTVMNLCSDITDLEKDTGFAPLIEFEKGIALTISWVKGEIEKCGH